MAAMNVQQADVDMLRGIDGTTAQALTDMAAQYPMLQAIESVYTAITGAGPCRDNIRRSFASRRFIARGLTDIEVWSSPSMIPMTVTDCTTFRVLGKFLAPFAQPPPYSMVTACPIPLVNKLDATDAVTLNDILAPAGVYGSLLYTTAARILQMTPRGYNTFVHFDDRDMFIARYFTAFYGPDNMRLLSGSSLALEPSVVSFSLIQSETNCVRGVATKQDVTLVGFPRANGVNRFLPVVNIATTPNYLPNYQLMSLYATRNNNPIATFVIRPIATTPSNVYSLGTGPENPFKRFVPTSAASVSTAETVAPMAAAGFTVYTDATTLGRPAAAVEAEIASSMGQRPPETHAIGTGAPQVASGLEQKAGEVGVSHVVA